MIEFADVTLAVLAGGAGRRMGKPKAWLTIDGELIVTRLHRILAWPGPTLLVSSPGREHPPGHEQFDSEVCDAAADQGPLRGVITALIAATTSLVLIVPVDMPGLQIEPLGVLVRHVRRSDESVSGVCYGLNGTPKPLPAVLRRSALISAESSLRENVSSLQRWYARAKVQAILPSSDISPDFWHNLNEPKDLMD